MCVCAGCLIYPKCGFPRTCTRDEGGDRLSQSYAEHLYGLDEVGYWVCVFCIAARGSKPAHFVNDPCFSNHKALAPTKLQHVSASALSSAAHHSAAGRPCSLKHQRNVRSSVLIAMITTRGTGAL